MNFATRLAAIRKDKGLTQQALADRVGVHVTQIRRYEAGNSAPTLDVLRELARALSVSADALVFDEDERGPSDDLRLIFEAASQLDDQGKELVKAVVEGVLLRHEAHRWTNVS
ncbi:MAG: helix-turn-helix domain-containing protein [Thermocrispum sp.]